MEARAALVFCLLILNVFVDSFPSAEDELSQDFDALEKRVEKIKSGLKRVSELVKSIGSNDTEGELCTPHVVGTDLHSDSTSTTNVVNGKWVTVNETTWTNGDGEEVAFYRVTFRKPLDASVSREELDEENSIPRSQRVPMKQEIDATE